jgi:3-phenylpropionate/cinnamic acid dioxygenase small subunit
MTMPMQEQLEVQRLIQQTAKLLDAEDLTAWLNLFDASGEYEVTAYSPELRRTLTWWKADHAALQKTLAEVPRHVRDPARRLRVLTPTVVRIEGDEAYADSPFAVYRTTPEGATSLYVVGRYQDTLVRSPSGHWLYRRHHVTLDTRMLDAFTHLPL